MWDFLFTDSSENLSFIMKAGSSFFTAREDIFFLGEKNPV